MKRLISLVSVIAFVLCMVACGEDVKKEAIDENGNVITTQSSSFGLNETAIYKNLKITATDLQESNGVEYFEAPEGKVYVGVKFEIENVSDEDQSISSMMMFSAYVDGVVCDYSISAMMAFDENGNTLDGDLAPGKKMIGYYAVEVPMEWENLEIQVQPDIISETKANFVFSK